MDFFAKIKDSGEIIWEGGARFGDLYVLADARIDNKNANESETEAILNAYLKCGDNFCKSLLGDFAFALYDAPRKRLILVRDAMGCRSLFFRKTEKELLLANKIKKLFISEQKETISKKWLELALFGLCSGTFLTCFNEIEQLNPATIITFEKNHKVSERKFWTLNKYDETPKESEAELIELLKSKLKTAINRRISNQNHQKNIACELSGGLDSSAMAGMISALIGGENLSIFSYVLSDLQKKSSPKIRDERHWIEQMTAFAKIAKTELLTMPQRSILELINQQIDYFQYPQCYMLPAFFDDLYRQAGNLDVQSLVSGFPGDELVSSSAFGLYGELADAAKWKDLYTVANAGIFLKHYLKRKLPFLKNSKTNNKQSSLFERYLADSVLDTEYIMESQIEETARQAFGEGIKGVRESECFRLLSPQTANRLCLSLEASRCYGVEIFFPLADRELIEFCWALPLRLRIKNGLRRYAFREAMRGFMPENLRLRTDKSANTIPWIKHRIKQDYKALRELISDTSFKPVDGVSKAKMLQILEKMTSDTAKVQTKSFYAALIISLYMMKIDG